MSGPQQALHVADDGVDVDHLEFEELFAAERQQLAGEGGGAVGGLLDGLYLDGAWRLPFSNCSSKTSVYPLITISRLLKSWATPPARRPTASIFCAWRKLLFELPPVGDVFGDQLQDFFRFVGAGGRAAAEAHDNHAAVFASPLHFHTIQTSAVAIVLDQPVELQGIDEDFASRIQLEKILDRSMTRAWR